MHVIQKINHFWWRAAFGPTPQLWPGSNPVFAPAKLTEALLKASKGMPEPLQVAQNPLDGLGNGLRELGRMQPQNTQAEADRRKLYLEKNRQEIRSLNLMWLKEMINSPAQLREKMAFFWHGHFACRNLNSFYQQQLLNVLRENALADFGTLLRAVSKTPAMLQFLNNQQNLKNSPNENFAREVMELFTLGRGHYTEQDVKEAARAFTGWGFNRRGEFVFRTALHDTGAKIILGKSGNFTGDEVLNLLLEQRQTARFITQKIYRFFVNDTPNANRIEALSKKFYENGYQIASLMQDILSADWFYDTAHVGNRIKSPVELLAGICRQLPMQIENEGTLLLLQQALGQVLLYPPSVAGWPGGRSWIDSSSLLLRMRLPQLIAGGNEFDITLKSDDDTEMGMGQQGMGNLKRYTLKTRIDWKAALQPFTHLPYNKLHHALATWVLQTPNLPHESLINQLADPQHHREGRIIALMSLPEYQLC
jgi:uncharacterized protein (DUF1800 family)